MNPPKACHWFVEYSDRHWVLRYGTQKVAVEWALGGIKDNLEQCAEALNGCAGLNPAAYRECVEALRSLVKYAHLYRTSSEEARKRVLFGQSLDEALPQAISEAEQALSHTQEQP